MIGSVISFKGLFHISNRNLVFISGEVSLTIWSCYAKISPKSHKVVKYFRILRNPVAYMPTRRLAWICARFPRGYTRSCGSPLFALNLCPPRFHCCLFCYRLLRPHQVMRTTKPEHFCNSFCCLYTLQFGASKCRLEMAFPEPKSPTPTLNLIFSLYATGSWLFNVSI